jgi:uroporphyrinogen decarboxylase
MNKRDRVFAAIDGAPVDYVPVSFSLHFPEEIAKGEASIKAHMDFYKQTDVDIMKIMNEYLVPDVGEIKIPSDWNKIPTFNRNSDFIQKEVELVKRILDKCDNDTFSLVTVHSVCASSIHPIESRYGYVPVRELQVAHLRENPTPYLDACKRITDAMCYLSEEVLKAGADGIYLAALGAERHFMSDEEFDLAVAPFDKQIMSVTKQNKGKVLLHCCKENLEMNRYADYATDADIINWGVYEAGFSLEEGRKLFPNTTLMGGIANRSGVLVDGTDEELDIEIKDIINKQGKEKFIFGADCTLPTEISYKRINKAVNSARF